jgi:CheY-like chemotaxis protein
MSTGERVPGQLAPSIASLTRAARNVSDRKLQHALLMLASSFDAFDKAPDPAAVDGLLAKARGLTQTVQLLGENEVAEALRSLAADLTTPPVRTRLPHAGVYEPAEPAATEEVGPPRLDLLFVAGDSDVRRVLQFRLRSAGYQVEFAAEGRGLVERVKTGNPSLIVWDLETPMVPGELLILALRTDPATAAIPIVALTEDPNRVGPEHRVDAVLVKPFAVEKLMATVRGLLPPAARAAQVSGA